MDTNKFIFFILFSFCYLLLDSLISVEARNLLASNGQTFTIDLIHRNYYNSLTTKKYKQKRLILGSISSNHHFHLSSKHYSHSTNTIDTQVIPNGGDYLMKIAIGTPPIELTAVADTGSDLVWVQCSPCQHCIPQQEPLFNPKRSSSYKPIPCNFQSCNYTDLQSTCIPNNHKDDHHSLCVYKAGYGDGTSSIGVLATDKLTFTSRHDHSSITFGCGFNQEGDFGTHGDGIIGLGTGNLSLVSQLGSSISHKFTYCLTPLSSSVNGKLKLGPNKLGPSSVSTPMVDFNPESTFYYLTLDEVHVGSSTIKVGQDVIIDSGTTYTYLESSVYDGIKNALKKGIELEPVPDPDEMLEPCYKAEEIREGFQFPHVVFHFKGAHVVLKWINTFITRDNVTCLAIVPTDDTFIFGNVAQINFQVEYDLEAKMVSFAPTDCTKY